MENRKEFIDKMSAKFKEWDTEIVKLEAKIDEVVEGEKAKFQENINELIEETKAAKQKINDIKELGEDAWMEMKTGTELAWESLSASFKKAWSIIK